jgi:hypothetical protein
MVVVEKEEKLTVSILLFDCKYNLAVSILQDFAK